MYVDTHNISRVKADACQTCAVPLLEYLVFCVCAPPGDSHLCHAPLQQFRLGAETTIITIFHMMEVLSYSDIFAMTCTSMTCPSSDYNEDNLFNS